MCMGAMGVRQFVEQELGNLPLAVALLKKALAGLNLAKAAAGFTTAATAGLTATVIGDPIAAQHILAQFNAILDKLLKIFY